MSRLRRHARVADRCGLPLIDLWGEGRISLATRGWYLMVESLQPGDLVTTLDDGP